MEQANSETAASAAEQTRQTDAGEKAAQPTTERKNAGQSLKDYFTATRVAYLAVFTALSYALSLLDFSLLPASPVNFLKLDFSNVFVMIGGFALGPAAGAIIAVLKELIHALTVGQTAFVGELANVLFVLPYMLIPAIVYKKHKGIKTVIWTLALGCAAQCLVSIPVNYFLNFPAFYAAFGGSWEAGQQLFLDTWYWAVLFNLIKTVLISVATLMLYKAISRLIKLTNEKFQKRKKS